MPPPLVSTPSWLVRLGAFWARARRFLRPPRLLKVTRTGRAYLLVTVGVGIGALNTGNNLLYLVLGVQLSLIVVSGVLSERLLRGLRIRRLGAEAPYANEPFAFRWELCATQATSYALTLRELDGGLKGEGRIGHLPRGELRTIRADLFGARRGPLPLNQIEVTTTFPLGLFAKSRVFELPGSLLVFPARRPWGSARIPIGASLDQGFRSAQARAGGAGELAELVELRPGEDARRIHWRKSAVLGKPLRAEREQETNHAYVLQLQPSGDRARDDTACEALASQAHHLLSVGHAVGLDAGEFRLRPAAGSLQERRLLSALARVGFRTEDLTQEEP